MVIDGKLEFYFDDDDDENVQMQIPTAKALHTFAVDHMPKGLVHNVNHIEQAKERLLSKKGYQGAVLLLTDKYETSSLYYSLAYHYRKAFVFGESRAKNLKLAKEFGVKKYPLLLVLVPKGKGQESYSDAHDIVRYTGEVKPDPIIRWLDKVQDKLEGKRPNQNTQQKRRAKSEF